MDSSLAFALIGGLTIIFLICALGIISDLRTGTSRLAHESHDACRKQLPLNFWLGVGSKAAGAGLALILIAVISFR